jgi:hypothetical protein
MPKITMQTTLCKFVSIPNGYIKNTTQQYEQTQKPTFSSSNTTKIYCLHLTLKQAYILQKQNSTLLFDDRQKPLTSTKP